MSATTRPGNLSSSAFVQGCVLIESGILSSLDLDPVIMKWSDLDPIFNSGVRPGSGSKTLSIKTQNNSYEFLITQTFNPCPLGRFTPPLGHIGLNGLNFDCCHCSCIISSIYLLCRASPYLSTTSLRQLYFTLVHPHLLYGITIYGHHHPNKTYLQPLIRIQKKIIRIIRNKPPLSPTKPLLNREVLTILEPELTLSLTQ